ncbi:MAG: hypothetical protein MUF08_17425 [Burkholderiaceae bacterium]|jgi:hypothetical protein|nr:hypothetical protein [Burkholderiaceae bacterium]
MKTGTAVRVVQPPPIEGTVVERRIVNDEVEHLVEWAENGERVRRWYPAEQLKEVAP